MRIGELARRAGVGVSTLRAWERRFGLLDPSRSSGRQRLYTEDDLERVCSVRRLTGEGLTLAAAAARVSNVGAGPLATGESEPLLRQIIQAADDGIWVSRDGRTLFVNRRMAELLRCSIDELLTRPVLDFLDPESVPLVQQRGAAGRAGRRQRGEVELRRADGSTFLAEVTTSPMHDQTGRYEGAVAIVRDVTARNAAEREARFRAALLDAVGEAVSAARPDGTVVYLNPAAERLLGWQASEVLGKNGLELFGSPRTSDEAMRIHLTLLAGKRHSGRVTLTRRDGTEFEAHVTSAPVFGEHDEIIGLIGVLTDLTESIGLREEVRARDLQLETVAMLGAHALHRPHDATWTADGFVMEALEAIRRVLQVDRTALLEVAPGGAELVARLASPPIDERVGVPAGSRSLAGYTALVNRVVFVRDVRTDRRFDPSPAQLDSGTVSAIAAPVAGPAGVCAVVMAGTTSPHSFDQSAVVFMQSMANVIGSAPQL